MSKFLAFLKHYWFGMLIGFILTIGVMFFVLVLLSPRQDMQKRGFIPCTETLAKNLLSCEEENKYTCGIKHIMQNSWCNIKIIGQGFANWVKGEQKAPWSNYIFEPQLADSQYETPDEEYGIKRSELDIKYLERLSDDLDKKNQELKKQEDKKDEETK